MIRNLEYQNQQLKKEVEELKSEIERLRFYLYDSAGTKCGDSCPHHFWYDGPLCVVTGEYIDLTQVEECQKHREVNK